jgi:hypothetical protein
MRDRKYDKIDRLRRNEAAIVIQRNCASKYRVVMSVARVAMVSLRVWNLMAVEIMESIREK